MPFEFTVSDVIPASPQQIYDAWLDSRGHSEMTGGEAHMSAKIGDAVSAWDGYISGKNLELDPPTRIVQSWRSTKFTDRDPDSKVTVTLEPVANGTRVTIVHSNVPDGHTGYQDGGWQDNYFEPMKQYFQASA
jgi:uncharacterized protein YndB with AHSA1/START domain